MEEKLISDLTKIELDKVLEDYYRYIDAIVKAKVQLSLSAEDLREDSPRLVEQQKLNAQLTELNAVKVELLEAKKKFQDN